MNKTILFDVFKANFITFLSSIITVFESIALIIDLFKTDNAGAKSIVGISSIVMFFVYITITILAISILIYTIFVAQNEYNQQKNRIFSESEKFKIDSYLSDFIKSGESVAILSHDMSWISEDNITMLEEKAQKKELLLFLPEMTDKVMHLKDLGADVRCFGKIISDPAKTLIKSRMTIINWNKAFPKLTYPIKKNGLHVNYEISAGEPANQLALDLIQALIALSEKSRNTMNSPIIDMVIKYIDGLDENVFDDLTLYDQQLIKDWYIKYVNDSEFSKSIALKILCAFYKDEKTDIYNPTDFLRLRDVMCEDYNIKRDTFLEMHTDFRRMLWG